MPLPAVIQSAVHFERDGRIRIIEAEPTELENAAMDLCHQLADEALEAGNPPVGAVLVNNRSGEVWGARTNDKTERNLFGHGEILAYMIAQPSIGNDLSDMTLVTSAQPCNTCTPPLAEGGIRRIVYAAPRPLVFAVCGIMRNREINMADLLQDGKTNTEVIAGYRAGEALSRFVLYGELRGWEVMPTGTFDATPLPTGWEQASSGLATPNQPAFAFPE